MSTGVGRARILLNAFHNASGIKPPLSPGCCRIVVVTSSGLKDPGASRTWLPRVPEARGDFAEVVKTLEDSYGLRLGA